MSYRVAGRDGEPAGPAVRAVRCTGGWLRHDVDGRDLFVYEKPSGKNRFQVYERGAGRRGTARKRAGAASLPEALRLACTLGPSTPEEILAGVETGGEDDRRLVASLIRYSRPGTRLWVLPRCGEHGYQGTGQPATALGLAVIGVENHASPAPAGPASPTTSSSLPRHVSPRRPAWTRSRPKSTRFSSRTSAEAEPRGAPYAGL